VAKALNEGLFRLRRGTPLLDGLVSFVERKCAGEDEGYEILAPRIDSAGKADILTTYPNFAIF
jgi:hypothetical protein